MSKGNQSKRDRMGLVQQQKLVRLYVVDKLPVSTLAARFGISHTQVAGILKSVGVRVAGQEQDRRERHQLWS